MPRLDFPDCTKRFFSRMYPEIDMNAVWYHERSPWYARRGQSAITIGRHVYFAEGKYDPCSGKGVALIAHELFHVKQGAGGLGIWFLRWFYIRYLYHKIASKLASGRKHPLEKPAYDQQDQVEAAYKLAKTATGGEGPCQCSDGRPGDYDEGFADAFFSAFDTGS